MIKRHKLNRLLFIAATLCILALCVLTYIQLNTLTLAGQMVNHTNLVKLHLKKIESSLNEAESSQRGYILTRQQGFLFDKELSVQAVNTDLKILDSLIADNKMQLLNASQLKGLVQTRVHILNQVIESVDKNSLTINSQIATGLKVMRMVQQKIQEMGSNEDRLLAIRMLTYKKQLQLAPALLFVVGIVSLFIVSISFYKLNAALLKARKLQVTEQQLEEIVAQRTAELHERNRFVETVLNASIDIIVVYDKDMKVLSFNTASEKFFGLKLADVLGRKYYDLFPGTEFKKGYYDLQRALKGEEIHNSSYKSDISGRMYENFLVPLKNAEGQTYAAVVIAHDITDVLEATNQIKQMNNKLQARNAFVEDLLNASPDDIFVVDKEFKIIAVNASALQSFNTFYHGQVLENKLFDVLPVVKNSEVHRDILAAFENHTVVCENRKSLLSDKYFYETFIPLENEGEVYAVMAVSHNITELVAVTTALQKTNASLEKMNEELTSFAHVASHDLQEPLRKIQIFVQRLREKEAGRLSEQAQDYFSRIELASKRMQQLIKDLLTYSSTNGHDKHYELTDLNVLLHQVSLDLKEQLEEGSVCLKIGQLPTVKVIPFQFQQLFVNLLANSIKFSKPGEAAKVEVACTTIDSSEVKDHKAKKNTRYHHISISDNGIGFDPKYKQQIFKVFQRLHKRHEYTGTGIGLSIVKKIVDTHNGFISASGETGIGATFHIYLPVS